MGAAVYGFPSRRLIVIGVTGTKGKTTVSHFIVRILEEAGHKVGAVTGLYFKVGQKEEPNNLKMTMPGRAFIQRKLRAMVDAGCTYAVVEVTSEGIKQHRHEYVDFDTAVFTNIAPEHLESHGGFTKYLAEKQKLFASLALSRRIKFLKGKRTKMQKTIIVNGDDPHAEDFLSYFADKKFCCHVGSVTSEKSDELSESECVRADISGAENGNPKFALNGVQYSLHLPGVFNVHNALVAIAVGMSEGCSPTEMAATIGKIKTLPGRMERIASGKGFDVVVDYAHTPDALEAVYETLALQETAVESDKSRPRLICVLGAAGGGRDKWKRPLLGAIAGMWGGEVIITNEDPYDEDPGLIIDEVAKGVEMAEKTYRGYFGDVPMQDVANSSSPIPQKILDRREAINKALSLAHAGDTVVITGKGAEHCIASKNGQKIPWDDREVVREELAKL